MGRKLIWTTLIAAVVYGIGMLAYRAGYLNIERLSKLMGLSSRALTSHASKQCRASHYSA